MCQYNEPHLFLSRDFCQSQIMFTSDTAHRLQQLTFKNNTIYVLHLDQTLKVIIFVVMIL